MDMLELARRGWPDSGPWERCTWAECPGLESHGPHVYTVLEGAKPRLQIHIHFDMETQVVTVLTIVDPTNPQKDPPS